MRAPPIRDESISRLTPMPKAIVLGLLLVLVPVRGVAQLADIEGMPKIPFFSLSATRDTLLAGSGNVVYVSSDRDAATPSDGTPAP